MDIFADIENLIKAILHIAPSVEAALPNTTAVVDNVVVAAKKAELATALIHIAVPSLTAGKTSDEIEVINTQLPKVVNAVVAVKSAYDNSAPSA